MPRLFKTAIISMILLDFMFLSIQVRNSDLDYYKTIQVIFNFK